MPAAGAVSVLPWMRVSPFFHLPVLITTRAWTAVGVAVADADAALVWVPSDAVTVKV